MQDKAELIARNLEEVLTREDLERLVASGTPLRHYIGFEISGKIHLGTLLCMSKVKDFVDAGVHCTMFLADWHSWVNDKLGGDRETIRRVGGGYFTEGLKATFQAVGGDPETLDGTVSCSVIVDQDIVRAEFAPTGPAPAVMSDDEFWYTEFTPGLPVPTRITSSTPNFRARLSRAAW